MLNLYGLIAGLIFGIGLIVSGMSNPAKVQAFLDLGGRWDPSLALVMAGAILVAAPAFAWAGKLKRKNMPSLGGATLQIPEGNNIDRRLIGGSLVFGIGWGLAGFCPGPALVGIGAGQVKALGFVLAMLAGMAIFEIITSRSRAVA